MSAVHDPNTPDLEKQHQDGSKALILNIVFFAVLLAGIVVVPFLGIGFSAVAISLAFVASLLYIYWS